MNNKIDGYLTPASLGATLRPVEPGTPRDGNPTAAVVPVDTVSLTRNSQTLRDVQDLLARQPDVDAERVAKIRQQVLEGRYVIDPPRIANQLLHLEWQLGA